MWDISIQVHANRGTAPIREANQLRGILLMGYFLSFTAQDRRLYDCHSVCVSVSADTLSTFENMTQLVNFLVDAFKEKFAALERGLMMKGLFRAARFDGPVGWNFARPPIDAGLPTGGVMGPIPRMYTRAYHPATDGNALPRVEM